MTDRNGREIWRKDCDCKGAGAVTNDVSFSVARRADSASLDMIATFKPGPSCMKCGRSWKLIETPPRFGAPRVS